MKSFPLTILLLASLTSGTASASGIGSFVGAQRNLGLHQTVHPSDVYRQAPHPDTAAPQEANKAPEKVKTEPDPRQAPQ
ncbi:MAG: hypothetical protein KDH88_04870 [Chromatiales bacterium]|nr:hypothetical protein [Chromatiales bacterium]